MVQFYDMKIRSKVNIETKCKKFKSKLIGVITNIQITNNFEHLIISYNYKNESDDILMMGQYNLKGEDIDTISDEVKTIIDMEYYNLPDRVRLNLKYYGMFIILTSRKFDIKPTDIEIIDTDLFEYK
jgi:hypothetical protein